MVNYPNNFDSCIVGIKKKKNATEYCEQSKASVIQNKIMQKKEIFMWQQRKSSPVSHGFPPTSCETGRKQDARGAE